MLFKRYNSQKRSNFIFCPYEIEGLKESDASDPYRVINMLERKYKESILDVPPYHFILTKGGFTKVKDTDLAHNDNSFLSAFNDDIKILVIGELKNISSKMIAEVMSELSSRYSMRLYESCIYATTSLEEELSIANYLRDIEISSISERHHQNPVMSVCEYIDDGAVIINENVIPVSNRDGMRRLKDFSDIYAVPISLMRELNPHVSENALKINDTIFVPITIALMGKERAMNAKKSAEYIHKKCAKLIREGLDLDV